MEGVLFLKSDNLKKQYDEIYDYLMKLSLNGYLSGGVKQIPSSLRERLTNEHFKLQDYEDFVEVSIDKLYHTVFHSNVCKHTEMEIAKKREKHPSNGRYTTLTDKFSISLLTKLQQNKCSIFANSSTGLTTISWD